MSSITYLLAGTLFAALSVATLSARMAVAQSDSAQAKPETTKWFVLRHVNSGYCRTELLVNTAGAYSSWSNLKAGGPYNTEQEALERKRALETTGTCARS